jgi:UDP-4-amino-4,6-dideoxy-N-acetyl-beta-L-altrosamine transaminase
MSTVHSTSRLALDGGKPVRRTMLPYGRQSITEADIQAVVGVLRSDWLTTGPRVAEFEEAFASMVGARHAVAFSSGTAALHGAAFAAGLGPGDEAITTPLTFCATANCVLYQRATPVFADVRGDTLNIDVEEIRRLITPLTKAILPVDFAGHPADLDDIASLAERHGLVVIEDASHALGARYRSRPVGAVAHMTVFSFHPVKHLTTGEGGMVTTDDEVLAGRMRRFRNHGIDTDLHERQARGEWYYEMQALGYNYRLSDIGCALGLAQLPRLTANVARRRQIAARYQEAFASISSAVSTPVVADDVAHAWHLYPVRVAASLRERVFKAMRAEGIGVNVHYIPVYRHPYYRDVLGFRDGTCPIAEEAYAQIVTLPMYHAMTDDDVEDVVTALTKVMTWVTA